MSNISKNDRIKAILIISRLNFLYGNEIDFSLPPKRLRKKRDVITKYNKEDKRYPLKDRTERHDLKSRLWLLFSTFLFPPKKRGKKIRRMDSKNRYFKSWLSAPSYQNILYHKIQLLYTIKNRLNLQSKLSFLLFAGPRRCYKYC